MREKLNILLVTPGVMDIPPKSWGAIEKVIWNYKIQLEKFGHSVDIDVPWDFKKDYDIIHSHMANQSLHDLYRVANKKYIFSLHDHHVYNKGKNSDVYKDNLDAIKKSIISLTHAEYMIDYFDDTDKLFYLSHGVDTKLYYNKNIVKHEHKLLCVANNFLLGEPGYDRKGFRFAIEAAKELDLPITIVGSNEEYFNLNNDLLDYKKLVIVDSPNENELIDIYNNHTIFVHMSDLEAGHPNLTLLEALSCGLPVVGTYMGTDSLGGLIKCKRLTSDVVDKINYVIDNYETLKESTLDVRDKYDWEIIVKKLEQIYYNVIDINEEFDSEKVRNKIVDIYNNTEINYKEPIKPKVVIGVDFKSGPKVMIPSTIGDKFNYQVDFIDGKYGNIIYSTRLTNGQWAKANRDWYTDWVIKVVNLDNGELKVFNFDIKDKNVYIELISQDVNDIMKWVELVDEFRIKHNCVVYCSSSGYNDIFKDKYDKIKFIDNIELNKIYVKYTIKHTEDNDDAAKNVLGL